VPTGRTQKSEIERVKRSEISLYRRPITLPKIKETAYVECIEYIGAGVAGMPNHPFRKMRSVWFCVFTSLCLVVVYSLFMCYNILRFGTKISVQFSSFHICI
jgi:hypothetical protein